MYTGTYLTLGENIGHEVINLIRSDNGDNYLWLNANGSCDLKKVFKYKDGKSYYDEIFMLMVMMCGYRKWKILGKAEISSETLRKYMAEDYSKESRQKQIDVIKEEKITYGGQPLNTIFDNNYSIHHPDGTDIYLTFKAKDVALPACKGNENIIDIASLKGLADTSLRMYLTEEKNKETFDFFSSIIEGEVFKWEEENTTCTVDTNKKINTEHRDFFLNIINEEYRELTFSNLLAYFLKNKEVMAGFAERVLEIHNFNKNAYTITREEKGIDLFIVSEENYIIIENKIRSTLIEKKPPMDNKFKEYFGVKNIKNLPDFAVDLLKKFNETPIHYQTDRYYAYACASVHKQNSGATIHGYVLCPNYAQYTLDSQLSTALFKEEFSIKTYKKVYDYFEKLQGSPFLSHSESLYLNEFLAGMKAHIKDVDNNFEEEMIRRFYKKILSSKE